MSPSRRLRRMRHQSNPTSSCACPTTKKCDAASTSPQRTSPRTVNRSNANSSVANHPTKSFGFCSTPRRKRARITLGEFFPSLRATACRLGASNRSSWCTTDRDGFLRRYRRRVLATTSPSRRSRPNAPSSSRRRTEMRWWRYCATPQSRATTCGTPWNSPSSAPSAPPTSSTSLPRPCSTSTRPRLPN